MRPEDFDRFEKSIRRLEDVFARKAMTDQAVQDYWRALKDLPIEEVEQQTSTHIKHGKHFPRPFELRPRDDRPKPKDPIGEAIFADAQTRACRNLDQLCLENYPEWERHLWLQLRDKGQMRGMSEVEVRAKMLNYADRLARMREGD